MILSIQQYELLANLPGAEMVMEGLKDISENTNSVAACLVRIARPRLSKAGLMENATFPDDTAELELYELLEQRGNQSFSHYNSLLRELVSFERALDHRLTLQSQ